MSEPEPSDSGDSDAASSGRQRRPPVMLVPWDDEAWALVVTPGSDASDLFQVLAHLPAGLSFSEAYGDVEVILVYRLKEDTATRREATSAALRMLIAAAVDDSDEPRFMTSGESYAYQAGKIQACNALTWKIRERMPLTRAPFSHPSHAPRPRTI